MSSIRLAVQKSGRLKEESLHLLKSAGIKISNGKDRLRVKSSNFPIEIYFLRNSDIPQYLEDNVVDIAIIGQNTLIEKSLSYKEIIPLGFSKCRLSLAFPNAVSFDNISDLNGKNIATSYPNTLRQFLATHEIQADIHLISGSVEIAPNIGLSDAICDLVSTGSTLFKNGLYEVMTILESEACLAKSVRITDERQAILDKLIFRIEAVLRAKNAKYILLNAPNSAIDDIANILPVLKSPTILPLAEEGWSSLHSVILEDRFWEIIDQLKGAGAEDILIIPIEKMVL